MHISSKNTDYGAAEQYLTFEHDEFTMKPALDKNGLSERTPERTVYQPAPDGKTLSPFVGD